MRDEKITVTKRLKSAAWTDKTLIPFGKHIDTPLGDVPADYLLWCYDQKDIMRKRPGLRAYIESGLVHLKEEAAKSKR